MQKRNKFLLCSFKIWWIAFHDLLFLHKVLRKFPLDLAGISWSLWKVTTGPPFHVVCIIKIFCKILGFHYLRLKAVNVFLFSFWKWMVKSIPCVVVVVAGRMWDQWLCKWWCLYPTCLYISILTFCCVYRSELLGYCCF